MATALKKLGQGNFAIGMVTFTVPTGKTWQLSLAVVDVACGTGPLSFNVYHVQVADRKAIQIRCIPIA